MIFWKKPRLTIRQYEDCDFEVKGDVDGRYPFFNCFVLMISLADWMRMHGVDADMIAGGITEWLKQVKEQEKDYEAER